MVYRRPVLLIALPLFFCHAVHAEDVPQTILSLPDEGAECRYVEALHQQAESAFASAQKLRDEGQAFETKGQSRAAAKTYLAAGMVAYKLGMNSASNVTAAIGQLKIKHPLLPACAVPFDDPTQQRVTDLSTFSIEMSNRSLAITQGREKVR